MSQKRVRQQQRRRRRKAAGRSKSAVGGRASTARPPHLPWLDPAHEETLAEMLWEIAELAAAAAAEFDDALEAELWASTMASMWRFGPLPDPDGDADRLWGNALVRALEQVGGADALVALRALAAVGADPYATQARAAADRLGAGGASVPPWVEGLGRARPVTALMMRDDVFDDSVSMLIEFARPNADPHTLGVYIDNNIGGIVKDAFVAGPLSEVRERFPELRKLDLAEARVRLERALDVLDHTLGPPVDKDVHGLRGLMYACAKLLPGGTGLPDEGEESVPDERESLLGDFLSSPEGRRWRGDEDAECVAVMAIAFGIDYNHGGPLRWSPAVVEIFMTGWLARKVPCEAQYFERVPEVLRDWVAYAGRLRGVPKVALDEAVGAVDLFTEAMLDAVSDPELWGPGKALVMAAQEAGVDVTDGAALKEFAERYNEELAA
jgi:hypothetical protein